MELMIDLETLDVTRTAVVLSVGMMLFDRRGLELGREVVYPSYAEQVAAGRTVGFETLTFWVKQEAAAAARAFIPAVQQCSLPRARQRFERFCSRTRFRESDGNVEEVTAVWANGDIFDLGICTDLFGSAPWKYNAPRDLRTLMREASDLGWAYPLPRDGHIMHSAIDDCRYQVDCLVGARTYLRGCGPVDGAVL